MPHNNCYYLPIFCLLFCLQSTASRAQGYIGAGFHLTPPISFDYTRNPYVIVRPRPGLGGSISYKREWEQRKNRRWYAEGGLSLQGINYYQTDYVADSVTIWSEFPNTHTGYPSLFFGGGYSFGLGNSHSRLSLGVEASYLLVSDLDMIYSNFFTIQNDPVDDALFPFYGRLNVAFIQELRLFRNLSGQLQLYANLSAQKLTHGDQFIRAQPGGAYQEGRYRVNNSELGVKFYTCLKKGKVPRAGKPARPEQIIREGEQKQSRFRWSLGGQLFAAAPTVYHIPRIDSFSITGDRTLPAWQLGFIAEFPLTPVGDWHAVAALGFGQRPSAMRFRSDGRFPADHQSIDFERHLLLGHYLIANAGLSRSYALNRSLINHILTASMNLPLEQEKAYLGVPPGSAAQNEPPPYEHPVLEGWIDYAYGRETVLFGIEYNPEIIFNLHRNMFVGIGLVANYSWGVMAQGKYTVSNGANTYYGASIQKFSKIGISVRLGMGE